MKTRRMNSRSLLAIVRFGAVVLITLVGFVLLTEGAKSTRSYSFVSKPRAVPRDTNGLKLRPEYLSTAIGFGKRDSSFRSADLDKQRSTLKSSQKDIALRFPLFWYLQYLRNNPELANKIERQYLADDGDDDDKDNARLSTTHRYKKGSDIDDSYYLNN